MKDNIHMNDDKLNVLNGNIHMNVSSIWTTHSYEWRHITSFKLSHKSTRQTISHITSFRRHSESMNDLRMSHSDFHIFAHIMSFSSHITSFRLSRTSTCHSFQKKISYSTFSEVNSPLNFPYHVIQTFSKVNLPLNSESKIIQKFSQVHSPLNFSYQSIQKFSLRVHLRLVLYTLRIYTLIITLLLLYTLIITVLLLSKLSIVNHVLSRRPRLGLIIYTFFNHVIPIIKHIHE